MCAVLTALNTYGLALYTIGFSATKITGYNAFPSHTLLIARYNWEQILSSQLIRKEAECTGVAAVLEPQFANKQKMLHPSRTKGTHWQSSVSRILRR